MYSVSDTFSPLTQKIYDNFILIGTDRRISFDEADTAREIIPQSLRLQLYDIKESFEPMISKRWKLFVKTMSRFNDILSEKIQSAVPRLTGSSLVMPLRKIVC